MIFLRRVTKYGGRLINRLANFLYFKAFTEKPKFTRNQEELISKLAQLAGKTGLNGAYRSG